MTLQRIYNIITEHNNVVEELGFGHKITAKIWINGYTKIDEADTYRGIVHNLSKELAKQIVDTIKSADFKKDDNYNNSFTFIYESKLDDEYTCKEEVCIELHEAQ